jgi:hypothetical protein
LRDLFISRKRGCPMELLRYFLMAASVGGSAFMFYIAAHTGADQWKGISFAIGLAINFVYLAVSRRSTREPRLWRLFGLWLDAKESELRKRAKD